MVEHSVAVEAAKLRAKKIANRLKELGVLLKHSHALEALSVSDGHLDWNRYSAHLNQLQSCPKPRKPMVLFSLPGGGASITWRMHSLNLIEEKPTGHVIIISPYIIHHKRSQEWTQNSVIFSGDQEQMGNPLYWQQQLGEIEGKIIEIMPSIDFPIGSNESNQKIAEWILAVSKGWTLWKQNKHTSGIFLTEFHRYFREIAQKDDELRWLKDFQSAPLFIFTQVIENLSNLEQLYPHMFFLRKDTNLSRQEKILNLNGSLEMVSSTPRHFSHEELGTFEGRVRVIGSPLTAKFNFSGTGYRWERFEKIMKEELHIHEEKIMREAHITVD